MVKGLEPLTRVAASVPLGLFINVRNAPYNATGDGTTDDRTAIQAADTAAALIGAAVYFPGTLNGYLVSGSVRPSSGATWFGDGYNSVIKCPDVGWFLVAVTNMGIINIDNKTNVRITGLRIRGTKLAPLDPSCDAGNDRNCRTPKLIYLQTYTKVMIDHCWFENSFWEGIWHGGAQNTNLRAVITGNYFDDVGWDIGTAACAVTLNSEEAVVSDNNFNHVGQAVGAAGARITVTGNEVKDVSGVGISTGDSMESGLIAIESNVIEFSESSTVRRGINLEGGSGDKRLINVVGNVVRLIGTAALGSGECYKVGTAENVNFSGNVAEIHIRGRGFSSTGSVTGTRISYNSNTVRIVSESGQSVGFTVRPNGAGKSLNIFSAHNRVYGATRAQNSFAYDYRDQGGGTLTGFSSKDLTEEGVILIGGIQYGAFPASTVADAVPFSDNISLTSFSEFVRYPQISTLNIQQPVSGLAIATGVLTISGLNGGAGFPNKQTRLKIDTESAAAADDLDSINGGIDGDIIILRTTADGRDVTVKNGTGNILCASDFTLSSTSDRMTLLYDGGLSKWVELSRWSPTMNVTTAYQIAGTKVVGPRETGWTAATGTANKGTFATYAGQDVSAAYTEAEVQTIDDTVKANSQRIKAIEDAMRSHGLIN